MSWSSTEFPFFCAFFFFSLFSAASALLSKYTTILRSGNYRITMIARSSTYELIKMERVQFKHCSFYPVLVWSKGMSVVGRPGPSVLLSSLSVQLSFPFCVSLIGLLWCLGSSHSLIKQGSLYQILLFQGSLFILVSPHSNERSL